MTIEVLDNIAIRRDLNGIVMARLRRNQEMAACVQELAEIAHSVGRPKAIYRVSYVDSRDGDSVRIDDVTFKSRVLRVNLDPVERVFPYVVTCGRELDEIAVASDDLMRSYCLDTIKRVVLDSARSYLENHLTRTYALGQMSRMSPGRLEDWPITQQKELFSLLGDVEALIGVTLTNSFLMVPTKSVSGIYFPTEVTFESCQLCPRERCEGRKALYDPELVRKYKGKA